MKWLDHQFLKSDFKSNFDVYTMIKTPKLTKK